ncbi:MAG: GerMN domain-containing protein [Chloroflexi bacterium]|nr:GerMN domain-containing protein [Chloroflexota bacterium]
MSRSVNRAMFCLWVGFAILTACAPSPSTVEVRVYFLDENRYAVGEQPFEVAVTRRVSAHGPLHESILAELFKGPTDEERARGLELITSGSTGFSRITIDDGIARVYLTGECNSGGATYTVANLILANLLPLDNIDYVKIYDQAGETEVPDGPSNSIPFCLEP